MQERKQEIIKVISLVKMAENLSDVSSPLKVFEFLGRIP